MIMLLWLGRNSRRFDTLLLALLGASALIVHAVADPTPRRRGPGGLRVFETRPGMGGNAPYFANANANAVVDDTDNDELDYGNSTSRALGNGINDEAEEDLNAGRERNSKNHEERGLYGISSSSISTSTVTTTTTTTKKAANTVRDEKWEEKAAVNILRGKNATDPADDPNGFYDIDRVAIVPEHLLNDEIYWIDATWKALDAGMNVLRVEECDLWRKFWAMDAYNLTADRFRFISSVNESAPFAEEDEEDVGDETEPRIPLIDFELIESKSRLKMLQISSELLDEYEIIGVLFKEICGGHDRQLIFKSPEDARSLGINENSTICDPFKKELQPNTEMLKNLSLDLNHFVDRAQKRANLSTLPKADDDEEEEPKIFLVSSHNTVIVPPKDEKKEKSEKDDENAAEKVRRIRRKIEEKQNAKKNFEKPVNENGQKVAEKTVTTTATEPPSAEEDQDDADWLELLAISNQVLENLSMPNNTMLLGRAWLQIDATDETNPVINLLYPETAYALGLAIPRHAFRRYEKVGLFLPGVCADYVPTAIDAFNASDFEGIKIEGPIGVNITALELAGVNLTELAEKLRNDTEVDEILSRSNSSSRALGGSYILPVLNKNQYDPFSAPIVFQGSAVVVRFGIYIESMSNFQTSTMDYDMDIYLLLAWRDARLVNPYDKPILVKEEEILEKIWRPDPFFDAKEAEFHEVTFLNFLMRIYNDGLVLYETRIKLKPACNLVLCKYPHDKQTCELQIKSFAYPIETVRFEWFTRKADAIDKNPDVKLPELYIDRYEPTFCNRSRKSGHFSCLRAVFRLKRDVGFHIAQTYIPTSLALMFSWVGVWLPEEFMEGRIGVAITVLLTLSTESAGAREHLPSVSYLKAIDLWFGYITGFVFFTLLQTLFIIGFDKRANQLRKWANRKRLDLTQEARDSMIMKANRYHKTGRYLDNFCRVFYPLSFILFLIMYYFVFTEGRQDDCISTR